MVNKGIFLEQLVRLIEQSIAPDAVVEQNVKLPILSSKSGATAQCDVVIRTGKPPRETITIVEVQDRQSPVDINTFRGWQEKMKEVGAQHLYCVSRHPFPESIREKAALSGNTVKLITLTKLDVDAIPLNFFERLFLYQDVDIPYARKKSFRFPSLRGDNHKEKRETAIRELAELKTNDLKFSFCPPQLLALSTICINQVSAEADLSPEMKSIHLGFDRPFFFFLSTGEWVLIQLEVEFTSVSKLTKIPHSIMSYDQLEDGTLAWVVECFYQSRWGPVWTKMPVTRSGDEWIISGMLVNMPENMQFNFHLEKRTRQKVERWKAVSKDSSS